MVAFWSSYARTCSENVGMWTAGWMRICMWMRMWVQVFAWVHSNTFAASTISITQRNIDGAAWSEGGIRNRSRYRCSSRMSCRGVFPCFSHFAPSLPWSDRQLMLPAWLGIHICLTCQLARRAFRRCTEKNVAHKFLIDLYFMEHWPICLHILSYRFSVLEKINLPYYRSNQ